MLDGRVVLVPLTAAVEPFPTAGSVSSPAALAHQSVHAIVTAARTAMSVLSKVYCCFLRSLFLLLLSSFLLASLPLFFPLSV